MNNEEIWDCFFRENNLKGFEESAGTGEDLENIETPIYAEL